MAKNLVLFENGKQIYYDVTITMLKLMLMLPLIRLLEQMNDRRLSSSENEGGIQRKEQAYVSALGQAVLLSQQYKQHSGSH